MSAAKTKAEELADAIAELGLESYLKELDEQGYVVVPPSITGVSTAEINKLTQLLLDESERHVGCKFTVENGPECKLDYGDYNGVLELKSGAEPSQFQLVQLCNIDRAFSDLAVNRVSTTILHHLIGAMGSPLFGGENWAARFSSFNSFIKWQGDGYGESLGLHCDQGGRASALGRKGPERELYVGSNRLHARRWGICMCARLPLTQEPTQPGRSTRSDCRGVSARVANRLSRGALARGIPEVHARVTRNHRKLFPPHLNIPTGRYP
jgi:hypothetical protein